MRPVNEKAESVTWSNPNKDQFDERTSFKKKRKYVYLDKYEDTVRELREDIVSLQNQKIKLWIVVGITNIVLLIKILM